MWEWWTKKSCIRTSNPHVVYENINKWEDGEWNSRALNPHSHALSNAKKDIYMTFMKGKKGKEEKKANFGKNLKWWVA